MERSTNWALGGLIVGLLFGTAAAARAKFQCDTETSVGRQRPATLVSVTVDGQPLSSPSASLVPQLGTLLFKTEFAQYPDMLHVDVFDDSLSPPVRKLHVRQQ